MKKLVLFLAILSLVLISCDGRKSKSVALKESIEAYNKKYAELDKITFVPKAYSEVVTDTIISNAVKVHIKNFSLPDEAILISSSSDGSMTYHRVFESEIVVSTSTRDIFSTLVSAAQFKNNSIDTFWDHATLEHVWVNQELSTAHHIRLDMSFINPKDNSYKLYRMVIDDKGHSTLDLIEENS